MKFDRSVGNPPYQEYKENTSARSIYPEFMKNAYQVSTSGIFVTPARFLSGCGNAGNIDRAWCREMLNSPHFRVCYHRESNVIFPNTDVMGGIVISEYNACKNYAPIKEYIRSRELRGLLEKIRSDVSKGSMAEILVLQAKIRKEYMQEAGCKEGERRLLSNAFQKMPVFKDKCEKGEIGVYGIEQKSRVKKYIAKKYIDTDQPHAKTHRVLVASSNGSAVLGSGRATPVISKPFCISPDECYTSTYIGFWGQGVEEAENIRTYLSGKFARACVGLKKITQHNHKEVWEVVPKQDFSRSSDIEWGAGVEEVDRQLYQKYRLTEEEREYIEENIVRWDEKKGSVEVQ